MFEAIIFDMDGTITVLTLPLEAMRRDTKQLYIDHGFPPEMFEEADGISSSTQKARVYFLSNGMSAEDWNRLQLKVDSVLSKHEAGSARNVQLIDGALDVIKKIRTFGLKTAILTNNGREAVDIILEQLPLKESFEIIQTRNESPDPKPLPGGLLKIISRLGVMPSRALYIGDARIDGVAAQRAGIEFWGVATGETTKDILKSIGATKVFDSLHELLIALQQIFKEPSKTD